MVEKNKIKIDPSKLKRERLEEREPKVKEPESVSAGPVEKGMDLAFNPSREKLREVTIIDRLQGRLFPLLDVVNAGQRYILEVAQNRESKKVYQELYNKPCPTQPNLLDEFMYRTAQWQKSVGGINLTKITDIALAEIETKAEKEASPFGSADWED